MICNVINDVKLFSTVYRRYTVLLQRFGVIESDNTLQDQVQVDRWLRMGLLPPPPREFCRHILSCRELKAESFKTCLHSVLRGVSLSEPVTYVTLSN